MREREPTIAAEGQSEGKRRRAAFALLSLAEVRLDEPTACWQVCSARLYTTYIPKVCQRTPVIVLLQSPAALCDLVWIPRCVETSLFGHFGGSPSGVS